MNSQRFKTVFFLLFLIVSPILMATSSEVKIGGPWWESLKEIQGAVFGDLSPTNDFPVEEKVSPERSKSASSTPSSTEDSISINTKSSVAITNIKPDSSEIRILIRQWIANAEPPLNAKGAQLHYDKWGRTVGRATNYIVKVTAKPDNVAGRTPEKYVWDIRNKLDSLNHCTLERYVQLRLTKQSIERCKSRYKAQRTADSKSTIKLPEVKGIGYKKALSKLKEAGLVVLPPELGSSAKTPEDVGKIERIQPVKNGLLHRGDKVSPILLGKVANTSVVPNVIGLGIKKAETVIKSAGLIPVFELGEKTKDQQKDKTIARQIPSKGADIKQGAKVKLFIFTYKSNKQSVPNLSGMKLSEAKKVLQKANMAMLPELGKNAAKDRDVGRIYQQMPKPGVKITKNTTIKVRVYGKNKTAETITSNTSLKTNLSKNVASGNIFILDRVEMQKTADPKDSCGSDQSCYRYTGNGGDGKFDNYYTYSKGKVTAGWKYYNSSRTHADYVATFLFASPPTRLILGQTLKLKTKASGRGFAKFGSGSLSRHFSYFIQYDGLREQHLKDGYVQIKSTNLPKQEGQYQGEIKKETVTTVTIPEKAKKEIVIQGKFAPNPVFTIRWIYKIVTPSDNTVSSNTLDNIMPNLLGLKISKAKAILQKMGLSIAPILGDTAKSKYNVGRIYQQAPTAGLKVTKNTTASVHVYGKKQIAKTSVTTTQKASDTSIQKDKRSPSANLNNGVPYIVFPTHWMGKPVRAVGFGGNLPRILISKLAGVRKAGNDGYRFSRSKRNEFITISDVALGKDYNQVSGFSVLYNEPENGWANYKGYELFLSWIEEGFHITPVSEREYCPKVIKRGRLVSADPYYSSGQVRMYSVRNSAFVTASLPGKPSKNILRQVENTMSQLLMNIEPYAKPCK